MDLGLTNSDYEQAARLDDWLRGVADRDHGLQEGRQFWQRLFDPASGDYPGEGATRPYRVVVAWRLLRQLARAAGLLHPEQSLSAWASLERSPWDEPADRASGAVPGPDLPRWLREVRELLLDPPACTMLPPPVPPPYLATQAMRDSYDPSRQDQDPALRRYVSALERCAARLRIGETRAGRWGLRGLLDPHAVRRCFPEREELEAFEEVLCDAVLERMVRRGDRDTADWLRREYDLSSPEIAGLMAAVDERSTTARSRTVEQWRAHILALLDAVRQQANDALDVRTARWAIRDMASVSGVLKAAGDDALRDMERAVDALDEEDDRIPRRPVGGLAPDGDPGVSLGDGTDG